MQCRPEWRTAKDTKAWTKHFHALFGKHAVTTLWPNNLLEEDSQASTSASLERSLAELFTTPGWDQQERGSKFQ